MIFSLMFSLIYAQIKEHPQSKTVAEGTLANFTCVFKNSGYLQWRIGAFMWLGSEYNPGDVLKDPATESNVIDVSSSRFDGDYNEETIYILATEAMDGTPIECAYKKSPKVVRYSKFAILNVQKSIAGDISTNTTIFNENMNSTNTTCL